MKRNQPSIYLDMNVISVMFYTGADPRIIYQRLVTKEWWLKERGHFRLCVSELTEAELQKSYFVGQKKSVSLVRRLNYPPMNSAGRDCMAHYVHERLVPDTKEADAAHLALATVHGIGYLMTWNHAHLANVATQERLRAINRHLGYETPFLVSPESLPWASRGQL